MSIHPQGIAIGSLTDLPGTYTYFRRGTYEALLPDLAPEHGRDRGKIPFAEGSLFRPDQPVGWKARTLLDVGVDIQIDRPGGVAGAVVVLVFGAFWQF